MGSGVGGHTVGRGTKGHNARQGGGSFIWFEGGQLPLIKRLPYWRGKFHFKSLHAKEVTLKVSELVRLEGQMVTAETLTSSGLIKHPRVKVKLVAGGTLPKIKGVAGIAMSTPVKSALERAGISVQ
jgi:large subunit ribosomal protein L15